MNKVEAAIPVSFIHSRRTRPNVRFSPVACPRILFVGTPPLVRLFCCWCMQVAWDLAGSCLQSDLLGPGNSIAAEVTGKENLQKESPLPSLSFVEYFREFDDSRDVS